MQTFGLIVLILVALGFDFTNGFHDAANAVAVSITTRALAPLVALGMAAALNVVGALVSTKVAITVGSGIIATPTGTHGLVVVFAALIGAIAWNLITWWFGLPSSSTHALIGGLIGAALASAGSVNWSGSRRQGDRAHGPLPVDRSRAGLCADARNPLGVSPGETAEGGWILPAGSDSFNGRDGFQSRHPRRTEDHGRHRVSLWW